MAERALTTYHIENATDQLVAHAIAVEAGFLRFFTAYHQKTKGRTRTIDVFVPDQLDMEPALYASVNNPRFSVTDLGDSEYGLEYEPEDLEVINIKLSMIPRRVRQLQTISDVVSNPMI